LLYDKYSTTGRQAFDEFEKFWNPNKDCGGCVLRPDRYNLFWQMKKFKNILGN
jgi:hypothetical protein